MTAPSTRPLKIGVMSFAHVHAASYLMHLRDADGIEVLSSDPAGVASEGELPRGRAFADLFGADYVDTYEELFAWAPDAVVICSENARHLDAVRLAVAAGADILCEKPLATSAADAEEIVRLARAHGRLLMTAMPIRFTSAFAQLAARVSSGEAGEVLAVLGTNNGKIPTGDRRWFADPELAGGGALVDHVVHCADLLDALLGEEVVWVRAVANRILHAEAAPRVETGGIVTLGYPSGIFASIDCSWSQPAKAAQWGDVTLEVHGTSGSLAMSALGTYISGTTDDGEQWIPFGGNFDAAMIDHFVACLRTGEQPQPDGEAGVRTTRIVDAAIESARTGRTVSIAR
jgi:1,5-anhydro-D-fructose reductase (1,5-anhydro-D-mannitol-forming)